VWLDEVWLWLQSPVKTKKQKNKKTTKKEE
jgi:hypothetical protein